MALFQRLTPQQLQALKRCRSPELSPLVDLLTSTLVEIQEQLLVADSPVGVHRLQGEAVMLKALLAAITAAHTK